MVTKVTKVGVRVLSLFVPLSNVLPVLPLKQLS